MLLLSFHWRHFVVLDLMCVNFFVIPILYLFRVQFLQLSCNVVPPILYLFLCCPQLLRVRFLHFPRPMGQFPIFSKNRAGAILVGSVFFGANARHRVGIDF